MRHGLYIWIALIRLPYLALSKAHRSFIDWRQQRCLNHTRLPKTDTSIAEKKDVEQNSPFLRLPMELRLRIYDLALQSDIRLSKGGRCILQPGVGFKQMLLSFHGPYPSSWAPQQHVRSDADLPSSELTQMLALGASAMNPLVAPPRRGCVVYGVSPVMLCGDTCGDMGWVTEENAKDICDLTTLLRVCSPMYREVMPLLYSYNTISLFGAEMVPFFSRNVSPDGLRIVRNVHLILRLDAVMWQDANRKQSILRAVRCLRKSFIGLTQLDVEVAVTWGQPAEANVLWRWLIQEVFSQLAGLEEFVLKVSVLKALRKPESERYRSDWTPEVEALSSWDRHDYQRLKQAVAEAPSS